MKLFRNLKLAFFILLFLFSIVPSSFAAYQKELTNESWNHIVQQILNKGTDMESFDGTYRTLSYIHPENKEDTHWAKYLSAVGAADSQGKFHAWRIHAVFEHWVLNQNNQWEIDQWLYVLNLQGQIQRLNHYYLKEEKDGHVLEHKQLQTGSNHDPLEIQRFQQFLEPWTSPN